MSIETILAESAKPKRKTLEDVCTPIFDVEMGGRLRLMREKLLLDQDELGLKFGTSRNVITRLERGHLKTPHDPFTVADIQKVFGKLTSFILFGTNAENHNPKYITGKYWSEMYKRQGRKKG